MNKYYKQYLKIAKSATPAQVALASEWYLNAELLAHDIVSIFRNRGIECNLEHAASVISSFSPRQRWARNVVQALEFAHGGEPAGLKNNLRMANWSMTLGFDALNGLKTNAFARNIAGDEWAVTIDSWMLQAVGLTGNTKPSKSLYLELSEAVRLVARKMEISPRTAQALIWIIYRGAAE